jgi:hypothetical protein
MYKFITQGYWWLIDNIIGDENARPYHFWRQNVRLQQLATGKYENDPTILISWIPKFNKTSITPPEGDIFVNIEVRERTRAEIEKERSSGQALNPKWKEEFEAWLSGDNTEDYVLEFNLLTNEDIEWVKDLASAMDDVKVVSAVSNKLVVKRIQ